MSDPTEPLVLPSDRVVGLWMNGNRKDAARAWLILDRAAQECAVMDILIRSEAKGPMHGDKVKVMAMFARFTAIEAVAYATVRRSSMAGRRAELIGALEEARRRLCDVEEAHEAHLGRIAGEVAGLVEEGFVVLDDEQTTPPDADESLRQTLDWFESLREVSE